MELSERVRVRKKVRIRRIIIIFYLSKGKKRNKTKLDESVFRFIPIHLRRPSTPSAECILKMHENGHLNDFAYQFLFRGGKKAASEIFGSCSSILCLSFRQVQSGGERAGEGGGRWNHKLSMANNRKGDFE